jgi:hypothetical protein
MSRAATPQTKPAPNSSPSSHSMSSEVFPRRHARYFQFQLLITGVMPRCVSTTYALDINSHVDGRREERNCWSAPYERFGTESNSVGEARARQKSWVAESCIAVNEEKTCWHSQRNWFRISSNNTQNSCCLTLQSRVVTLCTASSYAKKSTFCPHSVFMCFVWIWEQTEIISLYSINWLVFITETECVYCAVRT